MMDKRLLVSPLRRSKLDRASETLTRAFHDDPLVAYLIPDENRRLRLATLVHRSSVRYGLLYGEVYAAPNVEGVAVWLVPGRTTVTLWGMLRAGLLAIRRQVGSEAVARLARYLESSAELAQECVPGRHWHLLQLGVAPSSQGEGLGGSLIRPVLQRADEEGLPCYLDTFNAKALGFYEKHRFTVAAEAQVPAGGPHFWAMLREPASGASG